MSTTPLSIVRALHSALEAGVHGDALRPYFTDDAVTLERPNLIKPAGARVGLAETLKSSTAGAGLLARQKYDVHSGLELGSLAIVRLTWTAEIGRDVGPFRKGQQLTAHIAQFIETRDGRVAKIETYDCYEPLN